MAENIPGELAYHGQGYEDYYYRRESEDDMELGTQRYDDYNYKIRPGELDEMYDEEDEDDENDLAEEIGE